MNKLHLAPDLYATFENGLAYQFVPGRTADVNSIRERHIYSLVAKRMAQLHKAGYLEGHRRTPIIWETFQKFLDILPDEFSDETKHKR